MSEGRHTPGPFEVQNPMGSFVGLWVVQAGLVAHEWSCIAIVPRDEDRSGKHFITKCEQYANAALFAAAPDMLEALEWFVELVSSGDVGFWNPEDEDKVKFARAAISKAKGESK